MAFVKEKCTGDEPTWSKQRCRGNRDRSNVGNSLPSSTSQWDIHCLEYLRIFYKDTFLTQPSDILDTVCNNTKLFEPLTEDQEKDVKKLQNSMTHSSSISNILSPDTKVETFLSELYKDRENLQSQFSVVEDFIRSTELIVKCQAWLLMSIPEVVFIDMFKAFIKMCSLYPVPGSLFKAKLDIQDTSVTSEADVAILPEYGLNYDIKTVSVVSIVEAKNLLSCREFEEKGSEKTRPFMSSTSDSCSSEDPEHKDPDIYNLVHNKVLAQHGGQLLLHDNAYLKDFGHYTRYRPGLIVIGTQVIFTLLELPAAHLLAIKEKDISNVLSRAYIHYSRPKDLLKKEDRDIVLEAFSRLRNVKTK